MLRAMALLAMVALPGCAPVAEYTPYVQDVAMPKALYTDEADCLVYAQGYKPEFDLLGVAQAGAQGAANNAAGAAINPLVPVAGGLGGAGAEALGQLGLLGTAQRRVFLWCLHDRGEHSNAYHVMDPNL